MEKTIKTEIIMMLAEELERVANAKINQEQLVADLLEKLGLIEYKDGKIRLTEAGKRLVNFDS